MDPRRVLTFRMVARERSFSRAARALALTQPSVSQQVAALETEVGARLLDRRPGGLTLTPAGRVLLAHADVIADRLALAADQLGEIASAEAGTLRLGACPSALGSLVPPVLAALGAHDRRARATVEELSTAVMPGRVRDGTLHLAVTFQDAALERQEPEGLERHDLLHEPFLAALAPGHALAGADAVALSGLARDDWTAPSTDGIVVRACRAAGFDPRLVSVLSDLVAIRALVVGGHAVTLVPGLLAAGLEGAAVRPLDPPGPSRDVFALLPPGARHPLVDVALGALDRGAADPGRHRSVTGA